MKTFYFLFNYCHISHYRLSAVSSTRCYSALALKQALNTSTNLQIQLLRWSGQPPPWYWPTQETKVFVYQRKRNETTQKHKKRLSLEAGTISPQPPGRAAAGLRGEPGRGQRGREGSGGCSPAPQPLVPVLQSRAEGSVLPAGRAALPGLGKGRSPRGSRSAAGPAALTLSLIHI